MPLGVREGKHALQGWGGGTCFGGLVAGQVRLVINAFRLKALDIR